MELKIEKRDLFTVPKDYTLCHCISADFALEAGIAKRFAELGVRGSLIKFYAPFEWNGEGDCLFTPVTKWGVLNLVTKEKFWHKPTLLTLRQSLNSLKGHLISGDKIAMPKIGCGLDKLKWNDVEQIIKEVFTDTDVEILVCDWS